MYDGVGAVLLGVAVLLETLFLFGFEKVVGTVVEEDLVISFGHFQTVGIKLCLNEIRLLGDDFQGPINVLQIEVGRFQKLLGMLIGGQLGGRVQDPCVQEPGEDAVQVEGEAVAIGDLLGDLVKPQFVIDLLQEQIPSVVKTLFVRSYELIWCIRHHDLSRIFFFFSVELFDVFLGPLNGIPTVQFLQ